MKCILIMFFLLTNVVIIEAFESNKGQMFMILDSIELDNMNDEKYQIAYKHIVADSLFQNKKIGVSNKLINTYYIFFIDELWEKSHSVKTYEEAYRLDKIGSVDESTTNQFLDRLFKKKNVSNSDYTVYYSRIINNNLFVEVRMSQFDNTPFGESIIYLFRFKSDGVLDQIFRKTSHGL